MLYRPALALVALAGSAALAEGPYAPPAAEYTSVESTIASSTPANLGSNLRSALRTRINSGILQISYQNGRFRYDESDRDLDNPSNIITVYSGRSISSTWDSGSTWNREHTWPRSHMVNDSTGSPEYTDFHQLRPCISSVNSSRGNEPFGQGSSSLWDPGFDSRGGLNYSFDPQDRGEIARAMFYMATRFNHTLVNVSSENQLANGQMGNLSSLLEWHYEHVADEREFYRNHTIDQSNFQRNRNPFVDRNEYVWAIWGNQPNDSAIFLGTGSAPADGASAMSVDLGDVIVGNSFSAQSATITKTGATPTTYLVRTTGDAVESRTEIVSTVRSIGRGDFAVDVTTEDWRTRALAFPYGPASYTADITGITLLEQGTPGARSGTIVIDNTDLTSASAGKGSADGDDVITVTGREVVHSNASLASGSDLNSIVVDLGTRTAGDPSVAGTVDIHNLLSAAGPTAKLRWVSTSAAGDSSVFSVTEGFDFGLLEAGSFATFAIFTGSADPGLYAATYTVNVADEVIPGAQPNAPLSITIVVEIESDALCTADLDATGTVDLDDFSIFIAQFGNGSAECAGGCSADLEGDSDVDLDDFSIFIAQFGLTTADCNE